VRVGLPHQSGVPWFRSAQWGKAKLRGRVGATGMTNKVEQRSKVAVLALVSFSDH